MSSIRHCAVAAATLSFVTRIALGPGEGYGICKRDVETDGSFAVYSAPKNGVNPPDAQNFKYARWDEILAALGE